MKLRISHIATIVLFLPCTALAQGTADDPVLMDEVVVSASRLPIALERTPGSTTQVTREEIRAIGAGTAAELLRSLPGIHVGGAGGDGGPGFVHLRGADPNFTVVMIDGVRVNDPTDTRGGSFNFSSLDPQEIERIDIVRGPLSSVHGSDAIAGVIHIITRRGAGRDAWASAEAGPDDILRLAGGASERWGSFSAHANGRFSQEGPIVEGNDFEASSVDAGVDYATETQRADLNLRVSRQIRESYPESGGGPLYATSDATESERDDAVQASAKWSRRLREDLKLDARLTGYQKEADRQSPAIAPPASDPFGGIPATRSEDRLRRGTLGLDLQWGDRSQRLSFGGEAYWEDGRSRGEIEFGGPPTPSDFDLDRRVGSVYVEAMRHDGVWTSSASVRLDAPDGHAPQWSPRIGGRLRVPRLNGALKASWGEGFKLPSFFALANPIVGNESLDSEHSDSWDVGWVQQLFDGDVQTEFTWFRSRYEDLIDIDTDTFTLVNRSDVIVDGFEFIVDARALEHLRLGGQLSLSDSEVQETGDPLLDRPKWSGSIYSGWTTDAGHRITGRFILVGEVPDNSVPTGDVTLDSYVRLDLSGAVQLGQHLEAIVSLDNVLDAEYEEAVGFPAPGFTTRVGLRGRLGGPAD